jgi:hypothetical protein
MLLFEGEGSRVGFLEIGKWTVLVETVLIDFEIRELCLAVTKYTKLIFNQVRSSEP